MTQRIQLDNLLKRLGATLFILIIYVLGCTIPLPLVNISTTFRQILANSSIGIMSFMSGGNLQRLSLFSVGLSPLMIAMMIIQLLTMMRLFYFDTFSIKQMMRIQQWLTLIFAIISYYFDAKTYDKLIYGFSSNLNVNCWQFICSMVGKYEYSIWDWWNNNDYPF